MNFTLDQNTAFPLVEISLAQGEEVRIERGSMVYHTGDITLEGKMNSGGSSGLGGMAKAIGRSLVSSESFFITTAKGMRDGAKISIAPPTPGAIRELVVGDQQWRINDSAFLACDQGVTYEMKRQSVGKALVGGTGGFFVMESKGAGSMLVNSYGDICELTLDGTRPMVIDNSHVVAWSSTLDYSIKVASGTFGFTSGEGFVNEFTGVGTVLVQTRDLRSLARSLSRYMATS